MDFNKKLSSLSPEEFQKYFNEFPFDAHGLKKKNFKWETEYKKIGGKIEPIKASTESETD